MPHWQLTCLLSIDKTTVEAVITYTPSVDLARYGVWAWVSEPTVTLSTFTNFYQLYPSSIICLLLGASGTGFVYETILELCLRMNKYFRARGLAQDGFEDKPVNGTDETKIGRVTLKPIACKCFLTMLDICYILSASSGTNCSSGEEGSGEGK